jgi:hypothetical protein
MREGWTCLVELRVGVAADAGKLRAKRHFGKDERV